MKKRILASLLATVWMLSVLSGCGRTDGADPDRGKSSSLPPSTENIQYPEVKEREGARYEVLFTATKITNKGLTLHIYREEEAENIGELTVDEWFALERCTEENTRPADPVWDLVPVSVPAEISDVIYPIPAKTKTVMTIDWSPLYGSLEPGAYRMVQIIREKTADGEEYSTYHYTLFRIPKERFAGYGLTLADVPAEKMPSSDPVVEGEFRMTAEDVTPCGATLRFSHEVIGGYGYYLECYNGELWERVPYLPLNAMELAVPSIAIVLRETHPMNWTGWYGELEPGVYRIGKEMGGGDYHADYFAYFEITE